MLNPRKSTYLKDGIPTIRLTFEGRIKTVGYPKNLGELTVKINENRQKYRFFMLYDTHFHVKKHPLSGLNADPKRELLNILSTTKQTAGVFACMPYTENQAGVQGYHSGGTSSVPALVLPPDKESIGHPSSCKNRKMSHPCTVTFQAVLCPFATVDIQSLFSHPKFCQVRFNVSAASPWNGFRLFLSSLK